jgi:hypothetical protein
MWVRQGGFVDDLALLIVVIPAGLLVRRWLRGKYSDPPCTVEVGNVRISAKNYLGVEEILKAALATQEPTVERIEPDAKTD